MANTQGYVQSRESVDSKSTSWHSAPEPHQERCWKQAERRGRKLSERGAEIQGDVGQRTREREEKWMSGDRG